MKQRRKWEPTSTARCLMSWYFSVGLPFWPFPLVTQQISNYCMFFQSCIPNWWWRVIQMMEVREKSHTKNWWLCLMCSHWPSFFFPQSHSVGFSLCFWTRAAFWAVGQGIGMSCQILDSSWGRKWELQQRRRKIQFCMIYNASGKMSLKYGILTPY